MNDLLSTGIGKDTSFDHEEIVKEVAASALLGEFESMSYILFNAHEVMFWKDGQDTVSATYTYWFVVIYEGYRYFQQS